MIYSCLWIFKYQYLKKNFMVVHVLVVFNLLVLNLPTEIYQTKKEIYLFKIEKYLESMINNIFKKLLDKITK